VSVSSSVLISRYLASQLASQVGEEVILSVTLNPGNVKSALVRYLLAAARVVVFPLLYKAVHVAYTRLWASLSSDLSIKHEGNYIIPWGRVYPSPNPKLAASLAKEENDGTGAAKIFELCDTQTVSIRERTFRSGLVLKEQCLWV
jgi:hypothetical protein